MSTRPRFETLMDGLSKVTPAIHEELDSPYYLSNAQLAVYRHVLHDVGGQPALSVEYTEKPEQEWEMNTYLTCEVLGWRGAWNSEMRRRLENDLGATLYGGLPYYARWITTAAKVLIDKGYIAPDELADKIDEVRARLEEAKK